MTGDHHLLDSSKKFTERLAIDLALQAAGLGIWEVDPATSKVVWDKRCRALFGLAKDNLLSYQQASQYIHAEDRDRVDQAVQWAMNPMSDGVYDQTFRTQGVDDGQLRWVRFWGQAQFTLTGALSQFSGIAQEVTHQMLDKQRLVDQQAQVEQSQRQLLTLFEQSPVGLAMYSADEKFVIEWANTLFCELVARSPQMIVGKPLLEALPELKGQGFDEILRNVIAMGTPFIAPEVAVSVIRDEQLETIYVDLTYQPKYEADKRISGVLVVAVDVTQQVLARQKIEEKEQFSRTVFYNSPVAKLVYVGEEMILREANEKMLAILGHDASILGRPVLEAVPELNRTQLQEKYRRVLTTGEILEELAEPIELIRNVESYRCYYDYTYKPLVDLTGKAYGVICTAVDVTDQVLARQEVAEVEARLRAIITHLPSATVLYRGRELIVETPSQNFIDIIDRGPDVTGKPLRELMPELENQSFLQILDEVYTSGKGFRVYGTPVDIRQGDGSMKHDFFDLIYTPLFDNEGNVYAILSVATNVTNVITSHQLLEESEGRYRLLSTQLEAQVQQRTEELAAANEEMATTNEELAANNEEYAAINEELEEANFLLSRSNDNLQQFAYVASHDLQEPLRKIQQFGDLLKTRYAETTGDELVYLERMQSAAARMSTLIKDLLNYSRISTQRETSSLVPLQMVVEGVLSTLELRIEELGAQIQVGPLPIIVGDASQLNQLFQNVLSNALKFHRSGVPPLIEVRTRWLAADHLPEGIKPSRAAIAYHQIDVIDNGVGFDEKYLDRIFEVFQRLHGKNEYAGTGIGLAICEKVVTNHGGAITATSQIGQGATFTIYLPA